MELPRHYLGVAGTVLRILPEPATPARLATLPGLRPIVPGRNRLPKRKPFLSSKNYRSSLAVSMRSRLFRRHDREVHTLPRNIGALFPGMTGWAFTTEYARTASIERILTKVDLCRTTDVNRNFASLRVFSAIRSSRVAMTGVSSLCIEDRILPLYAAHIPIG